MSAPPAFATAASDALPEAPRPQSLLFAHREMASRSRPHPSRSDADRLGRDRSDNWSSRTLSEPLRCPSCFVAEVRDEQERDSQKSDHDADVGANR